MGEARLAAAAALKKSGVTAITGQMANVDVHELAWIFFSLSNVGFTGLKEILNEHFNSHASLPLRLYDIFLQFQYYN